MSVHTLEGLPRAHLVVNVGLTVVTPGRQVGVAEYQRVSQAFMVLEHMGVDVTTAVDLRLGSEHWVGNQHPPVVCSWANLHPIPFLGCIPGSKTDTPSSPGVLHSPDKVGSHPGLLQVRGILPPNGDTRAVVLQHKTWPGGG